jgi:hypothetical protein
MTPGAGLVTAVALAKRLWPVLAVVAIGLAIWAYGNSRAHDAKMTERAEWHAELNKARVAAAAKALEQQAAVEAANTARDAAQASLDALASKSKETIDAYYRNRPAVVCLSPERLRAIKAADKAATAAVAAK